MSSETDVAFGEEISIGSKATVVVSDWDTASSKAKVTISDADGHVWVDDYYSEGQVFDNTTEGYTITLKDVVISSILGNHVDIDWSASSLTLSNVSGQNNISTLVGLTSPMANWTVNFDARTEGLYSIQFVSPSLEENGMISLYPGNYIDADYFNISFDGWNTNNYTSIVLNDLDGTEGSDLSYRNNATSPVTVSLNLDGVTDVWQSVAEGGFLNANKSNTIRLLTSSDNFRFQLLNASSPSDNNEIENAIAVWSGSTNIWNLTATNATIFGLGDLSGGVKQWAYATFNTSGATYNLSYDNTTFNISLTSFRSSSVDSYTGSNALGGEFFKDQLTWTTTDVHEYNSNGTITGSLVLTEPTSKTITVSIKQGVIDSASGSDSGVGTIASGTPEYTYFGTKVDYNSNTVTMTYPESRRTADVWVGRSSSESTSFSVGDLVTGTTWTVATIGEGGAAPINPITPGIGVVDSTVTYASLSSPAILVGGPSANKGVNELGDDMVAVADMAEDRAYLQLVENAYGSGETVLVVAGYEAKDTRAASNYLAAVVAGKLSNSLTGTLVWLDTSSTSYTQVSVVSE